MKTRASSVLSICAVALPIAILALLFTLALRAANPRSAAAQKPAATLSGSSTSLWLSATYSRSNNNGLSGSVYGTLPGSPYFLLSRPSLSSTGVWTVEQLLIGDSKFGNGLSNVVPVGAGYGITPFFVPLSNRPDTLFFSARPWSSNDEITRGINIAITNPLNGSVFSIWPTNLTLAASAVGSNPVLGVAFYNQTGLLGWASSSPFTLPWAAPTGMSVLSARAFDSLGHSRLSDPVTNTVESQRAGPNSVAGPTPQGHFKSLSSCTNAPSGLIGWWRGEGDASDTLHLHDGVLQGGATANTSGEVGQAFHFDGTNGCVVVQESLTLRPTNFTIEAWVRFSGLDSKVSGGAPAGLQYLVFKQNSRPTDNFEGFALTKIRNGTHDFFDFQVTSPSATIAEVTSTNAISTNVWYHLAAVRGSNYIQLYTNGQFAAQTTVSFAQDYGYWPLLLGTSGQSWNGRLKGDLDEVSFYNRALSSNEIQVIYNAGIYGKCLPATTVSLLCPVDAARFYSPSNIFLTAMPYSPGTVTNVTFYANGSPIGSTISNLPSSIFQITWTNPPQGNFTLTAVASDTLGLSATSSVANINIIGAGTFFRGINLNGTNVPIEGNSWTNYVWALTNGLVVSTNSRTDSISNSFSADTNINLMLKTLVRADRFPPSAQQTNKLGMNLTNNISDAYFLLTLSNVPPTYPLSNAVNYRGWCLAKGTPIIGRITTLDYTYGPYPSTNVYLQGVNLNQLNYLVNHKNATNSADVQNAIWALLHRGQDFTNANVVAMTNDAVLHGSNFVPGANQIALVVCNTTNQPVGVEMNGTDLARTLTLTQTGLTNGYYYVGLWLAQDETNVLRSLDVKVQDVLAGSGLGSELQLAQWAKYGGFGGNVTNGSLKIEVISPVRGDPMLMGLAIYKAVTNPPSFQVTPTNQSVCPGASVTFCATNLVGIGPFGYQWRKAGNSLSGQTNSCLTLSNVTNSDAGTYSLVITNAAGGTTNTATLTVWTNVSILTPPANTNACPGGTASFCVTASGTGLNYQWYLGPNLLGTASCLTLTNVNSTNAGSYCVVVSGTCGPTITNCANLTIWTNVSILTPPANTNVCPGGNASFCVTASGSGLTYQWYLGTNLLGTTSCLTLTNVTSTNAGSYCVVVSGTCGPTITNCANLTVWTNVAILTPPANTNACPGGNASFCVTASGSSLGYQWYFGTNLLGTSSCLTLTNVSSTNAGSYCVVVSGTCGPTITNCANLTVWTNVSILTAPADTNACPGGTASFCVTARGTDLNYHWYVGTNLLGTASCLTLTNVSSTNAGTYCVVVSGTCGPTITNCATLTVTNCTIPCVPATSNLVAWWQAEGNYYDAVSGFNGVPVNDVSFASGKVGTAFSFNSDGSGIGIPSFTNFEVQNFTIEAWIQRAEPDLVSFHPSEDALFIGYRWAGFGFGLNSSGHPLLSKIGFDGLIPSIVVSGTNWHHMAITKTGTTVVFYVDGVAYPASAYGSTFEWGNPLALGSRGGDYNNTFHGQIDELAFYNRALTTNEIAAIYDAGSIGRCGSAPAFLVQPISQTAAIGNDAGFLSLASGTSLTYRWMLNSNTVSGATGTSFVVRNVQSTNAGSYDDRASNSVGVTHSTNAILTVVSPTCSSAPTGLVSLWRAEGDGSDATTANDATLYNMSFDSGKIGQAFSFDGYSSSVQALASSSLDVGSGPGLTIEAWINPSDVVNPSPVFEWNDGEGGYGVHLWLNAMGPGCLHGNLWEDGVGGHRIFSGLGLLLENRWQHIALTYDQTSGIAVLYWNGLAVATENLGSFTPLTTEDLYFGTRPSPDVWFYSGLLDEVGIYNRALSAEEIRSILNAGSSGICGLPPQIIVQPASQTVSAGSNVVFNVTATGGLPLYYQWRFDGGNLAGATQSSLLLTNVQYPQIGIYSVRVTNRFGSVMSSNAVLALSNNPPIVYAGGNHTNWLPQTNSLLLQGAVSDPDGPLGPFISWTKVSGPGTVRFVSSGTTNPAWIGVWFGSAADYTLRLNASDSQLSAHDDAIIHVLATNLAPSVYAGPDQTITFPDLAFLPGTASDDGLPIGSSLSVTWSKDSGSGAVAFDDIHSPATMASFSSPGTYVLRLSATDGTLTSYSTATVNVISVPGIDYLKNVDVLSAGIGGLRLTKHATIHLQGITGPVKKAYLYWHGPTDEQDPNVNSQVWLNGRLVTGKNIGFSHGNLWYFEVDQFFANSQAYRGDVTSLIATFGNGDYDLRDFTKTEEILVNGASLIVFYDNPASTNKHDIVLEQGNDSNGPYSFDIWGNVLAIGEQADGNIVIGGGFTGIGSEAANYYGRLNKDGSRDFTFDPGSGATPNDGYNGVNAVAIQTNGAILLAGGFLALDGTPCTNIARVLADGSVDTSFNSGTGTDGEINCLALEPDGKIIIAGNFTHYKGTGRTRIARLNTDGSLDTSFNPGTGADSAINAVALDSNGKILIAGTFTTNSGTPRGKIARLNTDGTLDTSFDPGYGIEYGLYVNALAIDSHGKILIGGDFSQYNRTDAHRIARINSNGSLDTSFSVGDEPNGVVYSVAVQDGTNVLVGGDFGTIDSHDCVRIARLKPDGTVDTSFASSTGADGRVNVITIEPNGSLLIGGSFGNYDNIHRSQMARLDHDGHLVRTALDLGWWFQVSNLHYTNGPASLELHVSDGQPYRVSPQKSFFDPTNYINGASWWEPETMPTCSIPDDTQLWAGSSVSNATTYCDWGLWDIREKSILGFLTNSVSPQTLTIEAPGNLDLQLDHTSLIVAMAKLPVGAITNAGTSQTIPTNLPPIARGDSATVHHGTRVQVLDVLDNDTSCTGGLLTVAAAGWPTHGATEIVYDGSAILYTPNPSYTGSDSFTYTVEDALGNTSTATVSLTVDGADPIALDCNQPLSGVLGQSGTFTTVRGLSQPADFYKFSGIAGNVLSVSLYTSDFYSHIYLRDSKGKLIRSGSHSAEVVEIGGQQVEIPILDSFISSFILPETGIYTIEVTAHSRRMSGNYTITADYQCSPHPHLELFANGILIPNGGVIDMGTDSSVVAIVTNSGTAGTAAGTQVYLDNPAPFQLSPPLNGLDSQSGLYPLPPNASVSITILRTNDTPGQKTSTFWMPGDLPVTVNAYVNPSGTPPTVSVTSPGSNSLFYFPSSVALAATATATTGATITNVEFFAATPSGKVKIGQSTGSPYSANWVNPGVGNYVVIARATDSAGRMTISPVVPITVAKQPPNFPPVAVNDYLSVFFNSTNNSLNVLTNDYDPNGDPLVITSASAQNGSATIAANGKSILYTPLTNSYGDDILRYTISDGHNGTAQAKVYVTVIQTTVKITAPENNSQTNLNESVYISADADTSDGAIAKVEFYANNSKISEDWSPPYTAVWVPTNTGVFVLKAIALDTRGFTTVSDPVRIRAGTNSDVPVAEILNLSDGQVIREGSFDLFGTASNLSATASVSYQISVYLPDDGVTPAEQRLVADLTPASTGRRLNQLLGHLDFSRVRNGAYLLELKVNGDVDSVSQQVRFILESNVKIGQFTFTEQDLVIPVSGIPLTATRTYNSINPTLGDFGYSWTYSLNDVDMQIDEDRSIVEDTETSEAFSLRTGGGRDVTLTMPDGRRTTFNFYWEQGACNSGDDAAFCFFGKWRAPYGINAKLTPLDDNRLVAFWGGVEWWTANREAGVESFDFSGFTLETLDGTKYEIQRTNLDLHYYPLDGVTHSVNAYGKGKLKKITTRAGDRIEISDTAIQHYNATNLLTRSLVIERTNYNLISAIRDPRTVSGRPALKYEYDTNLNLTNVYHLVNTNAAVSDDVAYVKTTYHYTNSAFPHFLTSIDDPRGIPAARSLYDSDGRLISMTDAAGHVTRFDHDLDNRKETITDPLGHQTIHFYDERGNVLSTVDALGRTTSRTYDPNNNVLSDTDALGNTTTHTYDDQGLVLGTTDPLGHAVSFTYDNHAEVLSSTDALGHSTTNQYNANGNLTASIQYLAGRPISTSHEYDPQTGQLTATIDPLTNRTEITYDSIGNAVKTTSRDAQGNILTETTCAEPGSLTGGYDASGNRLVEVTTRTLATGQVQTNVTRYQYDGQDRVLKTILPLNNGSSDDYTTATAYNSIGKADTTTDMYGRVTHYYYDARGNLTQTQYPDGTLIRTVYEELGRAIITTDRMAPPDSGTVTTNNGSRTIYDPVGRAVRTERLKDIVLDLVATGTVYGCQLQSPAPVVLSATTTEYDAAGRALVTTDELGNPTSYKYDDAGRRVTVADALGHITSYSYDDVGNQTDMTDALGRTTTYIYDDLNRRTEIHHPLVSGESSAVTTTVYDDAGRHVAETDLGGVTTAFTYDALGRLMAVTNAFGLPEQIVTWYTNDEAGNTVAQVDAEGRVTRFEYDAMGRRTKRTLPGSPALSETTAYEIVTNNGFHVLREKLTDFNSNVVWSLHDEMDRLVQKVAGTNPAGSPVVSFTYMANGQRDSMIDASGTNTYAYDDFNRLIEKNSVIGTLDYTYDLHGNIASIYTPYPGNYYAKYGWDELNRLIGVSNISPGVLPVTAYQYDHVGNLAGWTNAFDAGFVHHELRTFYHYDARNRLTDMSTTNASYEDSVWTTNCIAAFNYNPAERPLHPTGNRQAARETIVLTNTTITRAVNYYYDSLYRLGKEEITNCTPNGTITYDAGWHYTNLVNGYGYDRVGNRHSRTVSTAALTNAGVTDFHAQAFDDRDRLTGTGNAFDNNGNTLQGEVLPAQTASDEYDFENRLITRHTTLNSQPATIHLVYDGDGHRVQKTIVTATSTNTIYYLVDDRNPTGYAQVLQEVDLGDDTLLHAVRSYNYGHDILSQTFLPATNYYQPTATYFYGKDGHGNVRYLLDYGARITDSFTYDAFGIIIAETHPSAGATPNNYLYCGEQFDAELGLYYLRARYLSPGSGRFWTKDSDDGQNEDPNSLHKYVYGGLDPINNYDPSGNWSMAEILSVGVNTARMAAQVGVRVYVAYDRATWVKDGLMMLGKLSATGSVDPIALSMWGADFIPFGKIFHKVTIIGKKAVGASGPLQEAFNLLSKGVGRSKDVVQQMGILGATTVARTLRLSPTTFKPLYHGIDDIYEKGGKYIIVEAKGGTGRLTKGQMSREWIDKQIEDLGKRAEPEYKAWAERLRQARNNGNIQGMVVKTRVDKNNIVRDPEFELKDWAEIGLNHF